MVNVHEHKKIARGIEKTSELIRKKHRALKTGRIVEDYIEIVLRGERNKQKSGIDYVYDVYKTRPQYNKRHDNVILQHDNVRRNHRLSLRTPEATSLSLATFFNKINVNNFFVIQVIEKTKKNNIIMLSFPSHCSHNLQPLDVEVCSTI
ncbi:hypothetical protein ALC53_12516 [Atta colombica]|uniref:DDE-1 domain-containing protein n=1 Tax=Atta colombica TaxID=520822 RepID=A0A151HZ77_9HYME|nr:hypothetical protein ALC53_12516 [Atta colombica]